jgi:hypothetical protein
VSKARLHELVAQASVEAVEGLGAALAVYLGD